MNRICLSFHRILLLLLLTGVGGGLAAQDSLSHRMLEAVTVTSGNLLPQNRVTPTPTQALSSDEMEQLGHLQVSDAVRQMAGVTLKDYGGIGGIKTFSIRGLGSQFSALAIDGVTVNDAQNGQIDLGRYLLGGTQSLCLSNGQSSEQLQTARAYAAGSLLSLESDLSGLSHRGISVGMEAGSFGLLSPTLQMQLPMGPRLKASLFANWMQSDGDYPFTLYYGYGENDSSSVERRQNSQMHMGTLDGTLLFRMDQRHQLITKVHYSGGMHALPGPVTYYSTRGSEHSEESLFFAQSRYLHRWNERWESQWVGKYQRSQDVYEDTASRMSCSGLLHNEYVQQESYLSGGVRHTVAQHWQVSLSADGFYNSLSSNLSQYNDAHRMTLLGVARVSYRTPQWNLDANLLGTMAQEKAQTLGVEDLREHDYRRISPFVGIHWRGKDIAHAPRIRYYYKETYRLPTFSEMYYFTLTRDLEPERAMQHNLGFTWVIPAREGGWLQQHASNSTTLDLYYNRVSNKIIAIPTQNMFLWSMCNLGRAEILGADFTLNYEFRLERAALSLSASYSYQHAVDKSDPAAGSYNNQIPYTPRHSGCLNLMAQFPWLDAGVTSSWVGARYSMQQNSPYNRLDPYVDLGLHLSKVWFLQGCRLTTQVQVLNVLDQQYEVVKSYPMMGRNYRIKILINL